MRPRRTPSLLALPALLFLSGCGYVHFGHLPVETAQTTQAAQPAQAVQPFRFPTTTLATDEKVTKENADLRLEKKMLQQELALARAQGDALRMAIENRAADGDTSTRLVERLNKTSRELAALRANYAQMQTERNEAVASAAEANALRTRLGATEEKLAESLRTYTELQGEVTRLRTDVDRTRAENVALGEKVKTATVQNAEAQAALAQLNTELLTQKQARLQAEQDAATLRTELATVAPNASALAQQRTGAAAAASSLIAEHTAETAALNEQLSTLRAKVESLTKEHAGLRQQLATAEKAPRGPSPELAKVESKLATALRNVSTLQEENAQLKAASSQLEGQLSKQQTPPAAQVQVLRGQVRDAQTQATALTEENFRLKARLPGSSSAAAPVVIASQPAAAPAPATPRPVIHVNESNGSSVNASLVMNVPGASRPTIVRSDAAGQTRFHVVASGDTLSRISDQYYGTPGRWGDILAANRDILGETNNLVVGKTLRIP